MRVKLSFLICCLVLAGVLIFYHCSKEEKAGDLQVIHGRTMGTFYNIKYICTSEVRRDPSGRKREIEEGIKKVLTEVNQQMSTYIPDSEISCFNRYKQSNWFEVSSDLANVVDQALRVSQISGGAFDITVGPLVNLWGFGSEQRPLKIPPDEEIKEAMRFTGYQKLAARLSPPSIKKTQPEVCCDLAGIAKGYGVDKVAEYLESQGIANYLIEIGGEIRAKGKKEGHRWWQLGIASPDGGPGIQKAFPLKNASMATSGDYHNYFEEDGIRYSHTIDPGTGKPISHKLASVTVIHESCMIADALATAINVLGPEKGYDLALKENLAVFFIIKGENKFIEKKTPAFERILKGQE